MGLGSYPILRIRMANQLPCAGWMYHGNYPSAGVCALGGGIHLLCKVTKLLDSLPADCAW
eukprot:1157700-Pelagomonas_calceolata.AAC.5